MTATLDGDQAVCELSPGHKADGAEFNHFGVLNVNKQFDGGGTLWLHDVSINGQREDWDHLLYHPTNNVHGLFPSHGLPMINKLSHCRGTLPPVTLPFA